MRQVRRGTRSCESRRGGFPRVFDCAMEGATCRDRLGPSARIMADIAILAVGMTALPALCSRRNDSGVGILATVLALILTAATDRALFGKRHRAFWLGFTAAGWLCAAMALAHLQETRRYLLEHGPPLVRAREDFQRQHIAVHMARQQGVELASARSVGVVSAVFSFHRIGPRFDFGGIGRLAGRPLRGHSRMDRSPGGPPGASVPTRRGAWKR